MAKKIAGPSGHTGTTGGGNIRDVKVERIRQVTIYKRGETYYLYYRENKKSERRRIEGNLSVARATAAKVAAALEEHRPSPLGFQRTSPEAMRAGYLDYVENVQQRAWRTLDRYRAALDRFLEFCEADGIKVVDEVDVSTVENFVRWLRGQTRTRNGAKKGKRNCTCCCCLEMRANGASDRGSAAGRARESAKTALRSAGEANSRSVGPLSRELAQRGSSDCSQ